MSVTTSANRLSRLLALVPWLILNDGITIAEAASHFHVTPEQLEKDLWLLIVCGLPGHQPDQLVDIQFWDDARIHVLDAQTLGEPLRLSGDEAMSLLIALRLLAQIPGDHDREALLRATHRLQTAVGLIADDEQVIVETAGDTLIIETLNAAIADARDVEILYAGATTDTMTSRVIAPARIRSDDGLTYVEAFCRSAGAVRTFRLDRIREAVLAGPSVDTGAPELAESSVPSRSLVARISIEASAAWAVDILRLEQAEVGPDGAIVGSIVVYDPDWLVRTILSLAGAATVLEPASVRAAVADAATTALAAYASPNSTDGRVQ